MRAKGTIYESRKRHVRGDVVFLWGPKHPILFRTLEIAFSSVIAVLIISFVFTFGPIIQEELEYYWQGRDLQLISSSVPESSASSESPQEQLAKLQKEADGYGVNTSFSIVIPKIDAKANIISNVEASDKTEYLDALKDGVAHARGTYFPGQGKKIYLFSHSTDSPLNIVRYNAVFYLLRKLEIGDTIIVYFSNKRYLYEVEKRIVTTPQDIGWLTEPSNTETLLLQTCDPPGTTLKRLIVTAKPITN